MLKRIVTLLHRWVGLPLGALFLIALVSGLVVGGFDLLRAVDGKGQTFRETSVEEDARALVLMTREMPRMFQALLPTPWTPYYQARARGEAKTYRIGDLEPIDHRVSSGEFYRLALGLHRTFLLGRQSGAIGISGADAVAWVGLIATVLSLLGIWLWWSFRRSFRWRRTVPVRWTRSEMFRSHMTAGVVTVVVVVLLCVTGAAITYRGVARSALDASQLSDVGFREFPYYVAADWETWLKLARRQMDGDLTVIGFPRNRGGQGPAADFDYGAVEPAVALQFRFVTDSDWLGMAGSRVYIDPRQSALIGAARFDDLPLGQRLYSLIVPLHAGRGVTPTYLAVLLFFTALTTVMTFSGVVSFLLKLLKRRKVAESPAADRIRTEMRNLVIVTIVSAALGCAAGYILAPDDDSTPDTSLEVDGAPHPGQVGGGQGRGPGGGHGHGGRGNAAMGGRGPGAGGQRGPGAAGPGGRGRRAATGFDLSAPEESLAHMSVALTLDEEQQQAIREVMQGYSRQMRGMRRDILAELTPEQREKLGEIETTAGH